jgi:hypothetical protein
LGVAVCASSEELQKRVPAKNELNLNMIVFFTNLERPFF